MITTDLSKSFHPVPKPKDKKPTKNEKILIKQKDKNKTDKKEIITDFCIMPNSTKYSTKRTRKYSERHEVFFSRAYRNKSIKDGLIIFLTEEDHRDTNGVHEKNGDKLNRYLKKIAQKSWMEYYNKTKEEFIQRYGKNYL